MTQNCGIMGLSLSLPWSNKRVGCCVCDEKELIEKAGNHDVDSVKRLLDAGARVDFKDDLGSTALHRAALSWTEESADEGAAPKCPGGGAAAAHADQSLQ